jgi:hypothetical protein
VNAELQSTEFDLQVRACDCCGGVDVEEIWTNSYAARTRSGEYRFRNRNVVCRRCGFAFVSPCPRQPDLDAYYADALAHYAGQPPTSDISIRVEHLRSRVPAGLDGIEIGGNQLVYEQRVRDYFRTLASVEPNAEIDAQYATLAAVPAESADVLMHYYVLEHAADPGWFLDHCRRILRPGGLMICEVPDAKLYSRMIGEYVWWEHLSHFSIVTLARVAAASGFRLIDAGHRNCSNRTGMLGVFVREGSPAANAAPLADPIEAVDATAVMREGVALIEAFEGRLEATRREVAATVRGGGSVTLWGANEVMRRFLAAPFVLPDGAIVVDDDERKAGFIEGVSVRRPADVLAHLTASTLLVVASARLAERIVNRARSLVGPALSAQVRIIDYDAAPADWPGRWP